MATWATLAAPEHGWTDGMLVLADVVASPSFSGNTDAEVAAALNAQLAPQRRVKVKTWVAKGLLLKSGEWGGLVLLSRRAPTVETAQLVAVAITIVSALEQTSELDTDEPETHAGVALMLNAMVAAGALSARMRDALIGLADAQDPLWVPAVTPDAVHAARTLGR